MTLIRAADFLGDIGVATHIAYTDGGYANLTNVQADLAYLGVGELRDGISNGENGSAPLASYIQLAKTGEKFTFVVGGGTSTTASIQYTLDTIRQLAAAVPGSVLAVEGPNEINNQTLTFNGVGGLQGAVNLQQYLYSTVKADPALKGVAVDYFTGYDTIGFAAGPNPSQTAGLADFDTQHPYPNSGEAPAFWVSPSQALGNEPGASGPFVYTETGYTTNTSDPNGVDATVQGKYTLDLLMDTAKDGASETFLYQLMDAYKPGSPQGDDGYGLFDPNNAPKSAAVGLHDLGAILADAGATASTFTPKPLGYSVSGLPATGDSLAIAKSNGTTDIAVWAEPTLWNETTKSEVAAPTETVTVTLDGAHAVSVYDPLAGTAPIATYASTTSVQIAVTDHPLIVEVAGAGTSGQAPQNSNASHFGATVTSPASAGGEVYGLYQALLGRSPDPVGLEVWTQSLDDGLSVQALTQALLQSPEGQARSGAEGNEAFLQQIYGSALGRPIDPTGDASWTAALNGGESRAAVADAIAFSPEGQSHLGQALNSGVFVPDAVTAAVARLYYGILDRSPDAGGLDSWTHITEAGTSLTSVAGSFLGSAEFATKGAVSNTDFVAALYEGALGRAPEAGGLATWTGALNGGASRATIAIDIAESPEAQGHLVSSIETGWKLG